jgi:hypothetical protein
MLDVFKEVETYKPNDPSTKNQALRQAILKEIGERMKRGEPEEKFDGVLSRLLDLEMAERDEVAEEKWQLLYQESRTE